MTQPYNAVDARVGTSAGGKYRLVRLLGRGGMGAVYEAQHAVVGRRFAIKFLHPDLASNSEIVARFQREAQAAGGLENENIAAVVDAGTADDGAPFLVMEYLEGEDLAHLLVRVGPLPVPRAAYVVIQACRGLASAHERGIVHRDLKPENLFVCKRNDGSDLVKVLDFGIAKLHAGVTTTGLTHTGATMGTPSYMSLEQARGAKEVDHRTDIYALGVILYELLSGAKPHPGDSYNEILYHVITKEPAPLDIVRPGLPAGLATVVHRAMAREADERYARIGDFMEALIPFAGRAVTPLRTSPGVTSPSPESVPSFDHPHRPVPRADAPSPLAKESTDARPRRARAVLLSMVAALLLAAALVAWLRHDGASARPVPPLPPAAESPALSPAAPPPTVPAAVTPPPPPPAVELAPSRPAAGDGEQPTPRPPERPPGRRSERQPAVAPRPRGEVKTRPIRVQPAEPPQIPAPARGKMIREIDRQNPFVE